MTDPSRPIPIGFVGGGGAAMIGPVHRRAALFDGEFAIKAGVLSSDPGRARAEGVRIGLAEDRAYGSVEEMIASEAKRADGVEALAVVTPNDSHFRFCSAGLAAGLHVICDKPLTNELTEAEELAAQVRRSGRVFCLTHTYAGYPMIREARARVLSGALGAIRAVQVEYLGAGLAAPVETMPGAAKRWRLDPAKSGRSLVLGDLGTHAHHMMAYVLGEAPVALSAEVGTLVPGRVVQDYASLRLRFAGGARGTMVVSAAATGQENHIQLRVIGEKASLDWTHAAHNFLRLSPLEGPPVLLSRGQPGLSAATMRATRIARTGHPEGIGEAFATLYRDFAAAIRTSGQGVALPEGVEFPDAEDGLRGVRFVHAALASDAAAGVWVEC